MPQFGLSDTHDNVQCTSVFSSVLCQDKKCPVHHPPYQLGLEKFSFPVVTIQPNSSLPLTLFFSKRFKFYSLLIDDESAQDLSIYDIILGARSLCVGQRPFPAKMFLAGCWAPKWENPFVQPGEPLRVTIKNTSSLPKKLAMRALGTTLPAASAAPEIPEVHTQDDPAPPKNWFQTFTGKLVYALNPTPDMVDIQDIAHALSMTCRFGGHCRDFYSVAEHSVLVMRIGKLPPSVPESSLHGAIARLALLLHDAAEAYIGDIITPVKNHLDGARTLERRWLEAIEKKLDLPNVLSLPGEYVKDADHAILSQEVATLFSPVLPEWWRKFEPPSQDLFLANPVRCLSPAEARRQFLHEFHSLQLRRGVPDPWTVQP